jgi:small conductance mechanosensitive channel
MNETTDSAGGTEEAATTLAHSAAQMATDPQGSMEALIPIMMDQAVTRLPTLAAALAILVAGFWFAGRTASWVRKLVAKYDEIDPLLGNFLASILRYIIIILTVLAVLGKFGVETTSFIAVFGAAGLAIGLALQGTLSNLAAGVMLMIFRPFKIGDFVEVAGMTGSVTRVTMFITELTTPDNIQRLVPNGDVWGSAISNFAAHDTRRFDLVLGVGYGADINKAIEVISKVLQAEDRVHQDPEPMVAVTNLSESSVDITARAWCARSDYFALQCDLRKSVKEALDKSGVDIPFPTRTLIMENAG